MIDFRSATSLTTRPLTMADARAVYELAAAQEQHDLGKIEIEPADIVADWQRPSYDIGASTIGVFDAADLIGYAELTAPDRCDAAVHPDHRRRGIGTALAGWLQRRARELGSSVVGTPVPQGSPGDRLLTSLGYRVRWTSWVLALPAGTTIPDRRPPAGYSVREAHPDEYPQVHKVLEDAFLEWSVRDREPYQDFLAKSVRRPGFESWNLRVAVDPDEHVVGVAYVIMAGDPADEAYVDRLAVRHDQRHRGLAQALLVDAFARGRGHGASRSSLATDSRTGALTLYQKVGMVIGDVWLNRAIDL
ncbi:GNAT family N-acetyltransferase [Microlunatus elymi]|uniref:GNAT family N-acetyltransferase n=1 Tax=Microlunatus elymi TaxID=2596828 RepID=A0A516PVN9_9ACTN|nr:GNAT family N-acetyltransferase [Microlunatus elymi]QDP95254.1 GNAT family N-acetyltransferase [Microlunatus elymi]